MREENLPHCQGHSSGKAIGNVEFLTPFWPILGGDIISSEWLGHLLVRRVLNWKREFGVLSLPPTRMDLNKDMGHFPQIREVFIKFYIILFVYFKKLSHCSYLKISHLTLHWSLVKSSRSDPDSRYENTRFWVDTPTLLFPILPGPWISFIIPKKGEKKRKRNSKSNESLHCIVYGDATDLSMPSSFMAMETALSGAPSCRSSLNLSSTTLLSSSMSSPETPFSVSPIWYGFSWMIPPRSPDT